MKQLTLLLTMTLCIFIQSLTNAQSKQAYLANIGKADPIYSKILGEKRKVWVHVPQSRDKSRKYPVLYLLDGEALLTSVVAMFDLEDELFPETIIVAVGNRNRYRTRDLTPTADPTRPRSGGGEKFTDFIEKELIPYVDKHYPTTPYRTFVGHSLGGLLVVNTLIKRPHLFANYISTDPSLYWKQQSFLKEAIASLNKDKFNNKTLFVTAANTIKTTRPDLDSATVMQDQTEATRHLRGVLKFAKLAEGTQRKGLRFSWNYYANESHNSVTMKAIYEGLRYVFNWYQPTPADIAQLLNPATNATKAATLIDAYLQLLSDKMGYQFIPREYFMNNLGYMYLGRRQFKHSEIFFQKNVKYYPKSANVYDSLGDCYMAQGEFTNALECFNKAYKISGDGYHKNQIKKAKAAMKKGRK